MRMALGLVLLTTVVSSLSTQLVSPGLNLATSGQNLDLLTVSCHALRLRGGGACFGCTGAPVVKKKSLVEQEFVVLFEEQAKADNYAPALIGSWLDWNVSNAIPLHRDASQVKWSASISFSREALEAGLEYKYVLLPTDASSQILWEEHDNRKINPEHSITTTTNTSATDTSNSASVCGNLDFLRHSFNVAPACVDVKFEAEYSVHTPSEFVAVVGSSSALGRWKPEAALRLMRASNGSSTWKASVGMPFPKTFEFKFIILDSTDWSHSLWEGGPNRVCTANSQGKIEMLPTTPILQEMSEQRPPPEMMIRSKSDQDMTTRKVGERIGRLESFQRVLGQTKNVLDHTQRILGMKKKQN